MQGIHRSEDEPVAEMNMIPLIDISLTLLIIMMITTTFVKQPGFALKLPEASSRQGRPETPKDIVVGVDKSGKYWMDGKNPSEDELGASLKSAYQKNHDVRVLVKGDEGVPYGKVSRVMDIISQANIRHINLPTNPKLGQEPAPPTNP